MDRLFHRKYEGKSKGKDLFLAEVLYQLPQAEGSQHRAEGTGKTNDDCKE